jgi:fused signal recognition particle receptor
MTMVRFFKNKKTPKTSSRDEKGLFQRLRQGLAKTRSALTGRLDRLFLGKKEITPELLDELEEILYTSDIGVSTTQDLIQAVQEKIARKELHNPQALTAMLRDFVHGFLHVPPVEHPLPSQGEPLVIMAVGVNGVGKTTAIGKLANQYKSQGKEVLLAAADTFRAAAAEQLTIWGERVGAEVIRQRSGADPSAVVYDALTAALSRSIDVVLIDTAGRLHTKTNLMEELQKVHRVAGRKLPGAPHEVWLVLDATTGQNGLSQAEMFHRALGITGIILTKVDGTARGGIVVSICRELQLPIRYIGVGEQVEDLRPFDPEEFVRALFD